MNEWRWAGIEPRLDEMLHDPIVEALMLCDGVSQEDVLAAIACASRNGHQILVPISMPTAAQA